MVSYFIRSVFLCTLLWSCDQVNKPAANNNSQNPSSDHDSSSNNNENSNFKKEFKDIHSRKEIQNGLKNAYPYYLAVASPTVQVSPKTSPKASPKTSPKLVKAEVFQALSLKEKINFNLDRLRAGKERSCLPSWIYKPLKQPKCYGQAVKANKGKLTTSSPLILVPLNSPKMILDFGQNGDDPELFSTPFRGIKYGDSGITEELENNAPCLAEVATYYSELAALYVERATSLIISMFCAAKLDEKDQLPPPGETLDLTQSVRKVWAKTPLFSLHHSFISNQTKEENKPHFLNSLNMSTQDTKGNFIHMMVNLRHSYQDDYEKGRLLLLEQLQKNPGKDVPVEYTTAVNLTYVKKENTLHILLQNVFLGPKYQSKELFPHHLLKENGSYDFNKLEEFINKRSTDEEKKKGLKGLETLYQEMDLSRDVGKMSYGFSTYKHSIAPILVLNSKYDPDQELRACGIVGVNQSYIKRKKLGQILGFTCESILIDNTSQAYSKVEKAPLMAQVQCFKRKTTNDPWQLVRSKVKYTATSDCGKYTTPNHFDLAAVIEGKFPEWVKAPAEDLPEFSFDSSENP